MATIYLLILGAIAQRVVVELYDGVKPVVVKKFIRRRKPEELSVEAPKQEVPLFHKCGNGYTMKL